MRQDLIKPFIENDAPIQKQFEQVKSYLYQFREQVEMMLQNIDVDNMAPQLAEPLDLLRSGPKSIKVQGGGSQVDINILSDMIKTRVLESTEFGEIESSITQMSSEIALKVSSGDLTAQFLIGKLNSGSTYATIDADRISLEGYTTINNAFSVDTNGNVIIAGGAIDILGSNASDGRLGVHHGDYASLMSANSFKLSSNNGIDFRIQSADTGAFKIVDMSYYENGNPHTLIQMNKINGSYYLNLGDGTTLKTVQWKLHSAITSTDYVLVGT